MPKNSFWKMLQRLEVPLSLSFFVLLLPPLAFAGQAEVDAKMAPFEAAVSAEAVALARSNRAYGGLIQQTLGDDWWKTINLPTADAATGNPAGRTLVNCASIPRDGLAVIVYAGQSNSANAASYDGNGQPWQRQNAVYNYNIGDGRCYLAQEPELGADGPDFNDGRGIVGQAFGLPLADLLINAGLYKSVLVVPVGVSGTLVEQWSATGNLFHRAARAVQGLQAAGLAPTYFLWHQGEGNAGWIIGQDAGGLPVSQVARDALRLSYMRDFFGLVDGLRALGMQAPVLSAIVAGGCGAPFVSADLRRAHRDLADPAWGIFLGPDTDQIDFSLRRTDDQCHFSHDGNFVHAQRWFEAIRSYMQSHGLIPAGAPVATISATPADSPGGSTTISWFSQNVQSCNMRYTYHDGSPGGEFPLPANVAGAAGGGSGKRMNYVILCNAASGRLYWSAVTLTVWPGPAVLAPTTASPAVALSINGRQNYATPDGGFSVVFDSANASSCALVTTVGNGAPSSQPVTPNIRIVSAGALSGNPISYSFTCAGAAGQVTKTATVAPALSAGLTVNGQEFVHVGTGGNFTVAWTSTNAASCVLSWTIGTAAPVSQPVAPNVSASSSGALSGSPIAYSFTCDGPAGQQITRNATVSP